MGLNYHFKKAGKIIARLSLGDLITLEKICREIQAAENALISKGGKKTGKMPGAV
jgi:hypothetical protein